VRSLRREDDTQPQAVSIVKAEAELGFCARTDLKQGLQAFMDYYSKQAEQIRTDAGAGPTREGPHAFNKSRSPPGVADTTNESGAP
jgi:hypothetical protein